MSKYPISKEFGIFRFFKPPVYEFIFPVAAKLLSAPSFLFKDSTLKVEEKETESYDKFKVPFYIISPRHIKEPCPCLIYYHGGGFVFEGAFHHYRLPMVYAKSVGCKVIYVKYRLSPHYKFPAAHEDCFSVLQWVYSHAEELGIDPENIAVGGDSAGGNLAAGVCLMNRERKTGIPLRFQLLIYPFLDMRNKSNSALSFTDTPMWNSRLTEKVKPMVLPHNAENLHYISPVQAEDLSSLPKAYIETCEFDCLHDDGILYGQLLEKAGTETEIFETHGTMHGYDIALKAPETLAAVKRRTDYMKRMFSAEKVRKI